MASSKQRMKTSLLLLVVGFVLTLSIGFYLTTTIFKQVPVLQTTQALIPGQRITSSDLRITEIPAKANANTIASSALQTIIAHWSASQAVPAGTFLNPSDLALRFSKNDSMVYITPQTAPPDLQAGDVVDVLAPAPTQNTVNSTTPTTLPYDVVVAPRVTIINVPTAGSSSSSNSGFELAVPNKYVAALVAAEQHNNLAVIMVSPDSTPIPAP